MNLTPSKAKAVIEELKPLVAGKDNCTTILCVPFVDIATAVEAAKGSNIKIGAQNVHFEEKGAFTGEIAADMLDHCGWYLVDGKTLGYFSGGMVASVSKCARCPSACTPASVRLAPVMRVNLPSAFSSASSRACCTLGALS